MDTLGFEPRAFRMRSGCDATTPCAPCRSNGVLLLSLDTVTGVPYGAGGAWCSHMQLCVGVGWDMLVVLMWGRAGGSPDAMHAG